jgi:CheY-like chemotaxis protein
MNLRPASMSPPAKVLVVEDEPDMRQYVTTQLRELGYQVTAAATGAEALHLLSTDDTFDLLFTDLVLPGDVSGLELARRARTAFGADLKVLLTSGYPLEVFGEQTSDVLELPLLRKPYRHRELKIATSKALAAVAE